IAPRCPGVAATCSPYWASFVRASASGAEGPFGLLVGAPLFRSVIALTLPLRRARARAADEEDLPGHPRVPPVAARRRPDQQRAQLGHLALQPHDQPAGPSDRPAHIADLHSEPSRL